MKKLTFGFIALAIIVAVITNPKKEVHIEVISDMILTSAIESRNIKKTPLMKNLGKLMIDSQLKEATTYNNYLLFSTTELKRETVIIGVFGSIIKLIDKKAIKQLMNKKKEKNVSKANQKSTSIKTYKGAIDRSYPITMKLSFKNNEANGMYYYDKVGIPLTVKGIVEGKTLELNVVDKNNKTVEQFLGILKDNAIEGEWQKVGDENWLYFNINKVH